MKKNAIITACLSLVLVLGLAAGAQAAVWTADASDIGKEYTKKAGTWSSGEVALTGTNLFTFDWSTVGSWDSKSDPRTRLTDVTGVGKATWDWLTINIYRNGVLYNTYKYDDVDNGGNSFDPRKISSNIHFEYALPLAGTYVFEAIGHMTMDSRPLEAESWILNSAAVTATPIPAAAWLLGSGLVGLMGFKRARRNNA